MGIYLPLTSALSRIRDGMALACPLDSTACSDVGPLKLTPTVTGALSTVDGPFGTALSFGGTSRAQFADDQSAHLGITNAWSASLFWYRNATTAYHVAIARSTNGTYNWELQAITGTTNFQAWQNDGTRSGNTFATTSAEWHWTAVRGYQRRLESVTRNLATGAEESFYTVVANQATANDSNGIAVGGLVGSTSFGWNGYLARVAFWSRALTDREMYALQYWPMN